MSSLVSRIDSRNSSRRMDISHHASISRTDKTSITEKASITIRTMREVNISSRSSVYAIEHYCYDRNRRILSTRNIPYSMAEDSVSAYLRMEYSVDSILESSDRASRETSIRSSSDSRSEESNESSERSHREASAKSNISSPSYSPDDSSERTDAPSANRSKIYNNTIAYSHEMMTRTANETRTIGSSDYISSYSTT